MTVLLLVGTCVGSAASAEFDHAVSADYPDKVAVSIDSKPLVSDIASDIICNTTYVPIRSFCMAMGAQSVDWDPDSGTVTVTAPNLELEASLGSYYLTANGRCLYLPYGLFLIDNHIMVPVRELAKAFDASVGWNEASKTVLVTHGSGAIAPADSFYDSTDLYWMSRIIQAEAGGECLEGKIAVGNVILNRVASPEFPDTVYDVIFDTNYGVQFTPVENGAIYCTPSYESIVAAKIAFEGYDVAGDSLYFSSKYYSCWAARNRPYVTDIGNHSFYA